MSKWEITEAATKRIRERVITALQDDNCPGRPWEMLLAAMETEDYARPRRAAEDLIKTWIRNGEMLGFCTQCFDDYCHQRQELREAGELITRGLYMFQREFKSEE